MRLNFGQGLHPSKIWYLVGIHDAQVEDPIDLESHVICKDTENCFRRTRKRHPQEEKDGKHAQQGEDWTTDSSTPSHDNLEGHVTAS